MIEKKQGYCVTVPIMGGVCVSVLFYSILLYSILYLLYYIILNSIPILFYSILFYYILFYTYSIKGGVRLGSGRVVVTQCKGILSAVHMHWLCPQSNLFTHHFYITACFNPIIHPESSYPDLITHILTITLYIQTLHTLTWSHTSLA